LVLMLLHFQREGVVIDLVLVLFLPLRVERPHAVAFALLHLDDVVAELQLDQRRLARLHGPQYALGLRRLDLAALLAAALGVLAQRAVAVVVLLRQAGGVLAAAAAPQPGVGGA